jgi:hypothetical protein
MWAARLSRTSCLPPDMHVQAEAVQAALRAQVDAAKREAAAASAEKRTALAKAGKAGRERKDAEAVAQVWCWVCWVCRVCSEPLGLCVGEVGQERRGAAGPAANRRDDKSCCLFLRSG